MLGDARTKNVIGTTLSHYKILAELSRGGMGIVYRAMDTKLDREVAIKVLPPELVSDAERRRRFVQEAKAAASLHHPHIAVIHEIDEADGVTFIAMELIEGDKLGDVLARERLPLARSLELATEVAEGLARAHAKGIVHRDLKPANIMLTEDGHAKVIDFGLAKLVEPLGGDDSQASTAFREGGTDPGKVMGTISYMSPEQARGHEVDHRTDIFTLGTIIYEMTAGQAPFRGATGADTMSAILGKPAPPLPALGQDVSTEASTDLQRLIEKCLAKDPTNRYQGMKDLVVDLRAIRRRLESASVAPAAKPAATKKVFALAAAAVLVLIVGYALLNRAPAPPQEEEAPAVERKKIAVLPFENLGPPEDEYFADGMAEEITSRLAGVSGLGVISRNSSSQYKDTDKPTRQIGEELGVQYLLEGTVRWQKGSSDSMSGRVKVTPKLIQVSDDTQLWSSVYDRVTDDLFDVQSEIAQEVIQQMNVTLLAPEQEALTSKPTENMEALQAYQRGRSHLFRRAVSSKEDFDLAERMFERAVRLDPTFAEAHASLATTHLWIWRDFDRSEERLERATAALDRARELEPDLPLVHQSVGLYAYMVDRAWDRALSELSIAAKGLPNDAFAAAFVASVYRRRGDWDGAVTHFEKAVELDPRNGLVAGLLGGTYWMVGEYEKADRILSVALTLAPDQPVSYWARASNYWSWRGETAEARQILEEMPYQADDRFAVFMWFLQETLERNFDDALSRLRSTPLAAFEDQLNSYPKALLVALSLRELDRAEEARAAFEDARVILEERLGQSPEDHRFHSSLGITYAGLGRKEEAVAAGKRGVELMPVSKDAFLGPSRIHDLARICTMVGERDAALEQIDRLLSVPSFWSARSIKLDPAWDPLRDHPRYQEIIQKHR